MFCGFWVLASSLGDQGFCEKGLEIRIIASWSWSMRIGLPTSAAGSVLGFGGLSKGCGVIRVCYVESVFRTNRYGIWFLDIQLLLAQAQH